MDVDVDVDVNADDWDIGDESAVDAALGCEACAHLGHLVVEHEAAGDELLCACPAEHDGQDDSLGGPSDTNPGGERAGNDTNTDAKDVDITTPGSKTNDSPDTGAEQQCRICLGGIEDEPELGRLISPCLCTGSMRYVHSTSTVEG
jgi:hypothetical protein